MNKQDTVEGLAKGAINPGVGQHQQWLNRKDTPLPGHKATIIIEFNDIDGSHHILCTWEPYFRNEDSRPLHMRPSIGFLGTATAQADYFKIGEQTYGIGTGFNAWANSGSEFINYKIIE